MRALKAAVVVMGVLLIVGTGVLIAVIAARLAHYRSVEAGSATIMMPPGARIEAMTSAGDRLVLALVLADGSRQLLVIDLAQGRKLATITLRPGP